MKTTLLLLILLTVGCAKQPDVQPIEEVIVVVTNTSPIVLINDLSPDPYSHATTHPASCFEELGIDLDFGHGDGNTSVSFVGKVVFVADDGHIQPIPQVKFFRLNDSMLLREARRDYLPFTTDTNGNFQATIDIFAASGCRKGSFRWDEDTPAHTNQIVRASTEEQRKRFHKMLEKAYQEGEWLIYQTGTAILGVEADGYEARCVNVRYQQPSTMIVLNIKK